MTSVTKWNIGHKLNRTVLNWAFVIISHPTLLYLLKKKKTKNKKQKTKNKNKQKQIKTNKNKQSNKQNNKYKIKNKNKPKAKSKKQKATVKTNETANDRYNKIGDTCEFWILENLPNKTRITIMSSAHITNVCFNVPFSSRNLIFPFDIYIYALV